MRRGRFVIGIVLLLIGLVLVVLPFVATTTESVAPSQVLTLTPAVVGSGTVTVSWSGAPTSTFVKLYSCATSVCDSGSTVATGQGGSGSFSASLSSGQTYGIQVTGTGSAAVTLTLRTLGLTIPMIAGIVLLLVGIVVVALSFRRPAHDATPGGEAPPAPQGAAEGAPAPEPEETVASPTPTPPAAGGSRPPLTCAHCGAVNEVWLTNCRTCKRPLKTTG